MQFGMLRTKIMKALLHWTKYFYRISGDPTIFDLNKVMFIQNLDTTLYRADIREKLVDHSNKKDKEFSLGPLVS